MEERYTKERVREAVSYLFRNKPYVTSSDVAEEIGSSRETARLKLNELERADELVGERVGGGSKVWYISDWDEEMAIAAAKSASGQKDVGESMT